MDKRLLSLLNKKRKMAYDNPDSILKKYDNFLETHGIYHSLNGDIFKKSIKGHLELCEGILKLYEEATLENEQIALLEDLQTIGYDNNNLVELILTVFRSKSRPTNLWEYADLLYSIKNFRYIQEYITIIKDTSYGTDRQMLVLLIGKSKNPVTIPVLTELLTDSTVYGHALDALSNFSGPEIDSIMEKYLSCKTVWIREIAERYLSKRR